VIKKEVDMANDLTFDKGQSNVAGIMLLAAAAGAVAGILFAPKSGEETRQELRTKYDGAKSKMQDKAHMAKDKLSKGVEAARSKVHDAADKAKDTADKTADATKNKVESATTGQSLSDHIEAESNRRGRRPTL
jgi:gas vesicle protein